MKNHIGFSIILLVATSLLFITCKKDSAGDEKLDLLQVGNGNVLPSDWGIRGFNHAGMPVIHHSTDNLYEWDEANNTLNKLGNTIPYAQQVANSRVAQDAKGDYYYHSGMQGEVYKLNQSTNQWDLINIVDGYKNKMLVNKPGDILLLIDNRPIGGKESYFFKAASSADWVKLLDKPSDIDETAVPVFLSDDGLAFFNYASSPAMIDGSGIYSDIVLNTKTGKFLKLFDKSDPDNFPVTEGYNYNAFYTDCITAKGVIYVIINSTTSATAAMYKLTPDALPAKFVKMQDLDLARLEEDSYLSLRGYKIDEATGKVKIRVSCMRGIYSHKNIGIASFGSSSIKILEHDGPQRGFISGPDGSVYVQNWQGYLYKWK